MQPPGRTRAHSFAVLAIAIITLGTIAVWLGADGNGDLRNYHYYNGWALLSKAAGYDLAPAGIQSYHYPLLDSAFFLLARTLNHYPRVFTFVWAIPQAVAVWLCFHIARRALGPGRIALAWLAAAIGVGGATTIGTVGTSMSEGVPNAMVCGAILLILGADQSWQDGLVRRYAMAGALAGSAALLKLTNAPYTLAFGAAILVAKLIDPAPPRLRGLAAFGLAAAIAVVLLGSPWWWTVYRVTGNPIFPYLNAVFHSPYFRDVDFTDPRFVPRSVSEWLTYPLQWALRKSTRVSEIPVRDLRLLVELVAALGLVGAAIARRARRTDTAPHWRTDTAPLWLAVFVLAAYALWLKTFSILRYASGLETLSGVLIVVALARLLPRRVAIVAGACASVVLAATTVVPTWTRRPDPGPLLVDVQMPRLAADSTVLMIGPYETSFTARFQPLSVRYIGAFSNLVHDYLTPGFDRLIAQTVADAPGPLWTIASPGPLEEQVVRLLARWRLRGTDDCRPVISTIAPLMALCRLERLPVPVERTGVPATMRPPLETQGQ